MRADLLQRAADLAREGEPFALAFVVRRVPTSSSREGDLALVTRDGGFQGWLGGSCTQPSVVQEAQKALLDGKPRLLSLSPDPNAERRPGVVVMPMTCHSGGSVEIYIEPILPAPRLVVFGGSPIANALAELGRAMGYAVAIGADAEHTPAGTMTAGATTAGGGLVYAVVAAMGDGDEDAIRRALALAPSYLGVVASSKRFARLRETLSLLGVPAETLEAIRCPAGLDIGAQAPEEIAVSILAEIVERRRAAKEVVVENAVAETGVEAPTQALDPVCGMTVEIATAKHSGEHAGRMYYFCCGGCKTRFLAAPESFLDAGGKDTSFVRLRAT